MTALLTEEEIQFYDLSVECGSYCQGGRSRLEPTSWPDDYSVVKYPDHLAAIARYEARLAEDAKVRAGLVEALEAVKASWTNNDPLRAQHILQINDALASAKLLA